MKSRAEYDKLYKRSIDDPVGFWSDIAREFHWRVPAWRRVQLRAATAPLHASCARLHAQCTTCAARVAQNCSLWPAARAAGCLRGA